MNGFNYIVNFNFGDRYFEVEVSVDLYLKWNVNFNMF